MTVTASVLFSLKIKKLKIILLNIYYIKKNKIEKKKEFIDFE